MDFLISQIPAVLALLIAIISLHVVWHARSVALATGLCTVNLMLASDVIHQILNTFTIFSPGGAFLMSLPLALVAAQASRNGDDKMALETVHWTCLAFLFVLGTEFRRLIYGLTTVNHSLIDVVAARNAVLVLVSFYFSSVVMLALRRFVLRHTHVIWLRLTLPVVLTICVFTPLNIFAVLLSYPYETMTEVQQRAIGPWAFAVRAGIELIMMMSLYPLIRKKEVYDPPKVLP